MLNLMQYLVTLSMDRKFYLKNGKSVDENFIAQSIPFINIIDFKRTCYSSDFENAKLQKLEKLVKKLTPVELSSTLFVQEKESIISEINNPYPLILAGSIGKIFDVRKYDSFNCSICLKNQYPEQKYHEKLNELLINEADCLIWKSYSINIYVRPYNSNKYWEQSKYRLIKEFILDGATKEIDSLNEKFATQLKLIKPGFSFSGKLEL